MKPGQTDTFSTKPIFLLIAKSFGHVSVDANSLILPAARAQTSSTQATYSTLGEMNSSASKPRALFETTETDW